MDRERNLLFGVVAFQNGAVDADCLAETCAAWLSEPIQPLADLFVARGSMTVEQRTEVEKVVTRELVSHGGDPQTTLMATIDGRSLEAIGKLGGAGATLVQQGTLGRPPGRDGQVAPATFAPGEVASEHEAHQRYTLTHVYANGGIGRVWLANDGTLGRQIALKELHPEQVDSATACSRFLYEAKITAQLEHPGIVPVYELGEGRAPYYTMRFVRGRTLNEAGRAYHKKRASGQADKLGMAELLTAFVSVCHAVAYAHSRGIIHRDLKGQNVVLGDFGEVIVLDWGLAKRVSVEHVQGVSAGQKSAALTPPNEQTSPTVACGEGGADDGGFTLREPADVENGPGSCPRAADGCGSSGGTAHRSELDSRSGHPTERESGAGLEGTLQGQLLGTPGFMAPEQAQGRHDLVDQRTDVYGLGAILYEILTGRPPFVGLKTSEVIRKVYQEDPAPPRQLVDTIAPGLEAICLKALRKEPAQRYASASELAQEVQRHLADEPVTAYPERRLERLGRWFRKHRTRTYAAVASLIGICVIATIAAAVIEGSRRSEAQARREAELNFSMAQKAVDSYLTSVSESTLLNEQDSVDLRNLRQELLRNALKYYQQFVNQRSQDPRLRQELANAYFRVGEITREISSKQHALESFRSAETIWQQLAASDPKNDELKGRLAACQTEIGALLQTAGDLQGALNLLSQAHAILKPLAARNPEVPLYQANLANCSADIGLIHANFESPELALAMLQEAKALWQRLIERFPDDIGYRRGLAEVINELGYVYYKRLDYTDALAAFQEVQQICHSLLEQIPSGPKPVRVLDWLARSYYNMATIQLRLDQKEQALRSLEQSLRHRSALVAAHPSVTSFQEDLGGDYREIAALQSSTHQYEKALVSAQQSRAIFERLVQSHPDRARFHSDMGRTWNLFGVLHDEVRDNVKAIPAFERAVAEQERAVSAAKDVNEYKVFLTVHLENLGEEYVDLGQVDVGLPRYLKALAIRQELHRAHPGSREYALDLATALATIGAIQLHAGQVAPARDSCTRARVLLEDLAFAYAGDAAISGQLGMALTQEAVAVAEEQEPHAALPLLGRALELLTPLGSAAKANPKDPERLSEALWQLARVDRASGKSADAETLDGERVALWRGRPATELAELALKVASRATMIGYGRTPVPERAERVRELDLDLAAADLRLAVSQGFTDLALIESHPDSPFLLERDDLKALFADLKAPGRPSQTQPKK